MSRFFLIFDSFRLNRIHFIFKNKFSPIRYSYAYIYTLIVIIRIFLFTFSYVLILYENSITFKYSRYVISHLPVEIYIRK